MSASEEWEQRLLAGCVDERTDEIHVASDEIQTSRELTGLRKWIASLRREMAQAAHEPSYTGDAGRCWILEVFCSSNSQLTTQGNRLGVPCDRFGLAQGNLGTDVGRRKLFKQILRDRPRNIWYSPECSPWSPWNRLNASRSLSAMTENEEQRIQTLYQVALGIVLFEWQMETGGQFHWEQPAESDMWRLAPMHAVISHTYQARIDICKAGALQDPTNEALMQKPMCVLTTSHDLFDMLHGQRCSGEHEHVPPAGNTMTLEDRMNRSAWTVLYTRKLARQVVKVLASSAERRRAMGDTLVARGYSDDAHESSSTSKRRRLSWSPPIHVPIREMPELKRRRLTQKQSEPISVEQWNLAFQQLGQIVPRVGKLPVSDGLIHELVTRTYPEMQILTLIACRGTDRTLPPPADLRPLPHVYRRMIFIDRSDGTIRVEQAWERISSRPNTQIIRKGPSCRLGLTIFARPADASTASTAPLGTPAPPVDVAPLPEGVVSAGGSDVPPVFELGSGSAPSMRDLTPDERRLLRKAHVNLGHPGPEKLATLLKQQGLRPGIIRAARDMHCPECASCAAPKHARPARVQDTLDFNDVVAMDGILWKARNGMEHYIYHVVDHGTNFHAALRVSSKDSQAAIRALTRMWITWAGTPGQLLIDPGTDMNSETFAEFTRNHGIRCVVTSAASQWQNGRCERRGGILERMLTKVDLEKAIETPDELDIALAFCIQAKNACSLKDGFAPEMLVLGKQTRIPGSLASDETTPAHLSALSDNAAGIAFREKLALRERARRAFHAADNDESLRRALHRRNCPSRQQYQPGEWIMMWKRLLGGCGEWVGPLRVIVQENRSTIWATMLSKMYRLSPEHARPVTSVESERIPPVPFDPSQTPIENQLRGVRGQGVTRFEDTEQRSQQSPIENSALPESIPTQATENSPVVPRNSPTLGRQTTVDQPDTEPQVATPRGSEPMADGTPMADPTTIPLPDESDSDLITVGLHCLDVDGPEPIRVAEGQPLAWKQEFRVSEADINTWRQSPDPTDMSFQPTRPRNNDQK